MRSWQWARIFSLDTYDTYFTIEEIQYFLQSLVNVNHLQCHSDVSQFSNWANITHFNHHLNIFVSTLFKEIGTTKIVTPLKQIHSFNLYNRNAIPNRWELSKHNRKLSKAALSFRLVSYATGRKKYLILSCQMI